jgi:hypothetical protein
MLAGTAAALIVGELTARLLLPRDRFVQDSATTNRADPVLRRAHVPGASDHSRGDVPEDDYDVRFQYDQHGMRGRNEFLEAADADPAIRRIMLLGDSFVEQRQLKDEELMQTRLEQLLVRSDGHHDRVFAYGVSQWSPLEYLLYYKTQARRFRPDILFVFLTFNDYHDDTVLWPQCHFSPAGDLQSCAPSPDEYAAFQRQSTQSGSRLFELAGAAWRRATTGRGAIRDLIRAGYRDPGGDDSLSFLDAGRIESNRPRVRRSFDLLAALFAMARRDGVRPMLVVIPWPHQVGAQEWAIGRSVWGVPENYLERSTVLQDLTLQAAREAGIDAIDLLPVLRERATRGRMFFPFDGHFTPTAAESVATVLARAVRERDE